MRSTAWGSSWKHVVCVLWCMCERCALWYQCVSNLIATKSYVSMLCDMLYMWAVWIITSLYICIQIDDRLFKKNTYMFFQQNWNDNIGCKVTDNSFMTYCVNSRNLSMSSRVLSNFVTILSNHNRHTLSTHNNKCRAVGNMCRTNIHLFGWEIWIQIWSSIPTSHIV